MGKTLAVAASFALLLGACCRSRCAEFAGPAPLTGEVRAPVPTLAATPRGDSEIFLDAVVLRVPDASAGRVLGAGAGGRTGERLSAADGAALKERANREPGVSVVAAPKILSLAGQAATVFVGETYAVEGLAQDVPGYEGVDAPNWAGQRFQAVATPSADGATLGLDFSFALRDMPAKGAQVDFAKVKASEVRREARVRDMRSGDYLLLVAPATGANPDRIVVLMSAVFGRGESHPIHTLLTLSFRDVPLRKALQTLAEKGSLNLIVSPDVPDVPVSGDFRDQDVETILSKLGQGRFVWAVTEFGMVRITGASSK